MNLDELSNLLARMKNDLSSVLLPELQSQKAILLGGMMSKLLDMIRIELDDPKLATQTQEARRCAALALADALSRLGRDNQALIAELRDTEPSARVLSDATQALLQFHPYPDPAVQSVWDALSAALEAEERWTTGGTAPSREASYEESGSGRTSGKVAQNPLPGAITVEHVNDYIAVKLPHLKGARAKSVTQVAGGFSKDTFLVELEADGAHNSGWVLRRDLAYSPARSTVLDEVPLLQALRTSDVAAPEVAWIEPDASVFGAPVMAMNRLPGSSDASAWIGNPERVAAIVPRAAELLARLHHVRTDLLPQRRPGVPATQGSTPRELVAHMTQFWRTLKVEPSPLMESMLGWLDRNAPACFEPPVLVHSDFGFHNLLVEDQQITGLIDWEYSHVGDLHEDLASARQFVEKVMPWPEFISKYESASGFRTDAKRERYYSVVMMMRIVLSLHSILHAIRNGETRLDSKLAYVGRSYARRYLLDAARVAAIVM